jgi:rhamnose transport system permease protein
MKLLKKALRVRELPGILGLLLIYVGTGVVNPRFFSPSILNDILYGVAIVAILAIAQTFVIVMRHIDLSVGSVIGFTSFLIGDLSSQGFSLLAVLTVAVLVGATVGAINGFLVAYLGLPSLVVTLATLYIVRGIFNEVGAGKTVVESMVPKELNWLGLNQFFGVPYLFIIVVALMLIAGVTMHKSRAARDLYAIGSNPSAAQLVGIPVKRRILLAFVATGAVSGLAGAVMLARFSSASTQSGLGLELLVVAACVVGGVSIAGGSGSVFGAVIGAVLLQEILLAIGALGIPQFWQLAVNGALIIAAIGLDRYLSTRVKTSNIMGATS